MALPKVHYFDFTDMPGFPSLGTSCGMQGSMAPNTHTEFNTVEGFRYEGTKQKSQVTCKRCRKSLERRPWVKK